MTLNKCVSFGGRGNGGFFEFDVPRYHEEEEKSHSVHFTLSIKDHASNCLITA